MQLRVNDAVTAAEVQLIDESGKNIGVVSRDQALMLAFEKGVDLVEVAPLAKPPVAKLIDYGKYQYALQKKEQRAKAHQKESQVKEIRLGFKTDEHDFQTKVNKAKAFLGEGHKVRVAMMLRGREKAYPDDGKAKLELFSAAVQAKFDQPVKQLGNTISGILTK